MSVAASAEPTKSSAAPTKNAITWRNTAKPTSLNSEEASLHHGESSKSSGPRKSIKVKSKSAAPSSDARQRDGEARVNYYWGVRPYQGPPIGADRWGPELLFLGCCTAATVYVAAVVSNWAVRRTFAAATEVAQSAYADHLVNTLSGMASALASEASHLGCEVASHVAETASYVAGSLANATGPLWYTSAGDVTLAKQHGNTATISC
ncbi:hypothetical protein TREMEDRAFT_60467 [Tremella mesenterica DSM 1558]|uniref:uncharacterized protein n=1 Tax=Tremella mesenterica (strain ATCC 24925 / CBS 8224 / DSM 1558 / NBRC 9311 / NRRL Y-6157 / RJB 2259-6 / UBC 559-6) TaxID=578456 RepID=UPI0003F4922D|nr:uncharacterized protein TREMEDRAFT_60467 [Tremella mesenterica DSM 1558]EIW71543.1 hypothetical protein TREMEDRAFT_60467 [Tremella mesenterica DSM 1558]